MTDHHQQNLRWQLGAQVRVAYSTCRDGDQRDRAKRTAWLNQLGVSRCVIPRQVHGILIADATDTALLEQADGVVSADPNLALGVYGADCPGLVIDAGGAIGVAHCGWRGVAGGIVQHLVAALSQQTTLPRSDWQALIGPGISAEKYEVDQPVLTARTWPSSALVPTRADHALLHLPHTIIHDLCEVGVHRVRNVSVCTAGDQRLWSYRHHGAGLVQALIAWR